MNRDQQLAFCKVCNNKSFDAQQGIICKLTSRQADFTSSCPNFSMEAAARATGYDPEAKPSFVAELALASTKQRFLNYFIDMIIVYLLVFVLAFVFSIATALLAPDEFERINASENEVTLFGYALAILIVVCYYTFMESVFGFTVGKLITGTRVVDKHGKVPATRTIALRSVSRLVPFEAFSFLGSEPRGWHDTWTDTWVVRKGDL